MEDSEKQEEPETKEEAEDGPADEEKEEEAEEETVETVEEVIKKAEEAVELTDEEKAQWFLKGDLEKITDVTSRELSSSFGQFSLPAKDEGFDEVRFVWAKEKESVKYLEDWIKDQKLTQRVEDLQPGSWFKEQLAEWQKLYDGWRNRQSSWSRPAKRQRRKAPLAKKEKKEEEKKEEEKEEKKEDEEAKDGEDKAEKEKEDGDEKENKDTANEEPEPVAEEPEEEFDPLDVDSFDAENIDDLKNGQPLYAHFSYEDWTLLSLRFELHLLVHAFAADMQAQDPDRTAFHESHAAYYFKKYFKKDFNLKFFNCETLAELLELIPDVIEL